MDVSQPTLAMDVDSGEHTKTAERNAVTEASQKITGSGFGSRQRKKSKYLCYPYTTSESSRSTSPSKSKRFRRNWHSKFISHSRISSSPEFINASPMELLAGLQFKAVDCMLPTENKSLEFVEWFFCRYRIATYHDEAELATSLVDEKEGKTGKRLGSNVLDKKSGKKTKSLSGLSDMNVNISSGGTLRPGRKLKQKRKVEKASSSHQLQNVESSGKDRSVALEKSNGESKEELVLKGSNTELCVLHGGLAGNTANHNLLVSTASEVGAVTPSQSTRPVLLPMPVPLPGEPPQPTRLVPMPVPWLGEAPHPTMPMPITMPWTGESPHLTRPVPMPMLMPVPLPLPGEAPQPTRPVPVPMPWTGEAPQPTRPVPMPMLMPVPLPLPLRGEAPPPSLEFIEQNLQMMTSIMENSGNNLSPQMKAILDTEIKNLLRKVNARAQSGL